MTSKKERLEKQLQDAREQLAQVEKRLQVKGDYGPGTGDPLVVRWEVNLALRDEIRQKIERLEDAVQRVDQGEWGICESCGKPIDPERLQALPDTVLCIECAQKKQEAR